MARTPRYMKKKKQKTKQKELTWMDGLTTASLNFKKCKWLNNAGNRLNYIFIIFQG